MLAAGLRLGMRSGFDARTDVKRDIVGARIGGAGQGRLVGQVEEIAVLDRAIDRKPENLAPLIERTVIGRSVDIVGKLRPRRNCYWGPVPKMSERA